MAAGSCPHPDDAVFRRTSERDVFGRRTGRHRRTLAKAGMVEPLVRGEIVGVAIGGAGERAARGQRGKAVLRSEGIEIKREGRRCKNYASNAREDSRNETAFRHHTMLALRGGTSADESSSDPEACFQRM